MRTTMPHPTVGFHVVKSEADACRACNWLLIFLSIQGRDAAVQHSDSASLPEYHIQLWNNLLVGASQPGLNRHGCSPAVVGVGSQPARNAVSADGQGQGRCRHIL